MRSCLWRIMPSTFKNRPGLLIIAVSVTGRTVALSAVPLEAFGLVLLHAPRLMSQVMGGCCRDSSLLAGQG